MMFPESIHRAFLTVVTILSMHPGICPANEPTKFYLLGNSLTWDTVPSKLDGDTQWHVDCGKNLPYIVKHPEEPCVTTSTLWPSALKEKQYDVISLQVHYGSTLAEDVTAISRLIKDQPQAKIVIHTGWARSAERVAEWTSSVNETSPPTAKMVHSLSYFKELLKTLRNHHPAQDFKRTRAMDLLQQVEKDIAAGKAPIADVADLYRDKIHMNTATGRYLMHNAMRDALGQPRSAAGFERLKPEMKSYLDSVLEHVMAVDSANRPRAK